MSTYQKEATCAKCGGNAITTRHVTFIGLYGCDMMERRCMNCGYHWYEEPLDAPHPTATGDSKEIAP